MFTASKLIGGPRIDG